MEDKLYDLYGFEETHSINKKGTKIFSKNRLVNHDNKYFKKVGGRFLSISKYKSGYLRVFIANDNNKKYFLVHRLVAMTFIPNPKNLPQVNHKNGVKSDNTVENLEWCTPQENSVHYLNSLDYKTLQSKRKIFSNSKRVQQINISTREVINTFNSCRDAAKHLGVVTSGSIGNVASGKEKHKSAHGYFWKFI